MGNTTPMSAEEYDSKIEKTIPFYTEFYKQTIDLIKAFGFSNAKWLDTGCGTGALISKAISLNDFDGFQFVLCDPSEEMMDVAKNTLAGNKQVVDFCVCGSQQLGYIDEFTVITAIQSHHYMKYDTRVIAVKKCYEALKENGIFICFENFAPNCEQSKSIAMDRWGRYQSQHGKSDSDVETHLMRYGKNYFPITIAEHFSMLKNCGFRVIEIFWLSYMQVGIYAIK